MPRRNWKTRSARCSTAAIGPPTFGATTRRWWARRPWASWSITPLPTACIATRRITQSRMMGMNRPRTLFEKLWDAHIVSRAGERSALLYIDLHLVHEVTSPQAFDGLRLAGRTVRRPDLTFATVDHNVPTVAADRVIIRDPIASRQMEVLRTNCAEFGIPLFDIDAPEQGIVHVIGPELGLTRPGMTA